MPPVLLYGALAASLVALALTVAGMRRADGRLAARARLAALAALAMLAFSAAVLLVAFLSLDFSYFYVWNYTEAHAPLYQRVAGFWAGQSGSVFLWTIFVGAALAFEEWVQGRIARRDAARLLSGAFPVARAVVLAILVAFIAWTIMGDPFAATDEFRLSASTGFFVHAPGAGPPPSVCTGGATPLTCDPDGFGLNPLLATPFMIIHPPIQIAAYAFTALLFAASAAYLVTEDRGWLSIAEGWGRVSWLLFSAGLAIGALWAYYVLSFGGYWAWDPVEVSDLVAWIALTAFLHGAALQRRGKPLRWFLPLLALLPFLLTLFSTVVTRSALWISAHAFDVGGSAIIQDPMERTLAVLATKPAIAYATSFLLVAVLFAGILFLHRFHRLRLAATGKPHLPALAFLGLYAGLAILSAVDVHSLFAQVFRASAFLGPGNALLGLAILAALVVGIPLAFMVHAMPDDAPPQGTWVNESNLLVGAVTLLSLGLTITAAILLIGVNLPIPRMAEFYESREPFIVVPIALLLTFTFTFKRLGQRDALLLCAATGVAGAVGYLLFPDLGLLALGVPLFTLALAAVTYRVLAVVGSGSAAPPALRLAGALLILSALAGYAFWSSPPSVLSIGPPLAFHLWQVPAGLALSTLAFVSGVATMHGRSFPLAVLGALAGIASLGYVAGGVLAAAALSLAVRERARFEGLALREALVKARPRLYGAGQYLSHVGMILIVIGYGASAFHEEERDFKDIVVPLERGIPAEIAGYTIALVGSQGVDRDADGAYEDVGAFIEISRGGERVWTATVSMYWVEKERQYRPTEDVFRQPLGDLYFNSNVSNLPRMHVQEDACPAALNNATNCWISSGTLAQFTIAGENPRFPSDKIDKLQLSVKHLPLVAPVWTGAFLLPFGMGLVLALGKKRWTG